MTIEGRMSEWTNTPLALSYDDIGHIILGIEYPLSVCGRRSSVGSTGVCERRHHCRFGGQLSCCTCHGIFFSLDIFNGHGRRFQVCETIPFVQSVHYFQYTGTHGFGIPVLTHFVSSAFPGACSLYSFSNPALQWTQRILPPSSLWHGYPNPPSRQGS